MNNKIIDLKNQYFQIQIENDIKVDIRLLIFVFMKNMIILRTNGEILLLTGII